MTEIVNKRFVLLGQPIAGGMADVYKAVDLQRDGKHVAVKMFRDGTGVPQNPILLESFRREIDHLRELKHDYVVELIDSGVDGSSGRHFLVFPWLETDLERWLESNDFAGWDDFYEQMGRPILEGLSFVHEREYVHRDLKPRNILLTANGTPKITDFGISKLKSYVEPGVTLAHFHSPPYTPPEFDDGSYSFSRDVYGFAAIAVKCLTKANLQNLGDIYDAIDGPDFDPPEDVKPILARCLDPMPQERYRRAGILLTELEKVWKSRKIGWSPKRSVFVRLSSKAVSTLKQAFLLKNDQEATDFYLKDLRSICGAKKKTPKDGDQRKHFDIYSESLSAHAVIDDRSDDHLYILAISPMSRAWLGDIRESTWIPDENFAFQKKEMDLPSKAKEDVLAFAEEVDKKFAELEIKAKRREEEGHFELWGRMLDLKSEIERTRNPPIRFFSRNIDGPRVTFEVGDSITDEVLDQNRIVRLQDRSIVKGVIDAVSGTKLTMYMQDAGVNALPESGKIEFDSWAAEQSVYKQKEALDILQFERSVDPSLKRLLAKPSRVSAPTSLDDIVFVNADLDEAKKRAVRLAMGAKEFLLVEGPPGTGKTTFIAEVILQQIRSNPHARILLASQTHVALDNCAERLIRADETIKIVRIASQFTEKRVSPFVKPNLLRERVERWKTECLDRGKAFLETWAKDHSISKEKLQISRLMKEFIVAKKRLVLNSLDEDRLLSQIDEMETAVSDTTSEVRSEQVSRLKTEISQIRRENKLVSEAASSLQSRLSAIDPDAEEFLSWNLEEIEVWNEQNYSAVTEDERRLSDLLEIHSEWEEQFGRRDEFLVALLGTANVVAGTCLGIASVPGYQDLSFDLCIVDEATKATPTETLIPLVRSKKWIVVGDEKQLSPFQAPEIQGSKLLEKYELQQEDFKKSLFSHLSSNLPTESKVALNIQHRMVAPIGTLVSECFYDGALENSGPQVDTTLSQIFPRSVMWFSTVRLTNRFETRSAQSYFNSTEATEIAKLLKLINAMGIQANIKYKVAVIAGYLAQVGEIKRAIYRSQNSMEGIEFECDTVDAFQGRESDVLIYSVTRMNASSNIGFLREYERINVAMSRGRLYLGVVGDHVFCRSIVGTNPFKSIVDHIEKHPAECKIVPLVSAT